jgi:hypothetical protein
MGKQRLERGKDVVFRQVGDECILVPIRRTAAAPVAIFSLNAAGAFVWSRLATPRSPGELAAEMAAAFEVGEPEALRDVTEFLDQLSSRGLVVTSAPPEAAAP